MKTILQSSLSAILHFCANVASILVFFAIATWWAHDILDKPADRHLAARFNEAVDKQTNKLIAVFRHCSQEALVCRDAMHKCQ